LIHDLGIVLFGDDTEFAIEPVESVSLYVRKSDSEIVMWFTHPCVKLIVGFLAAERRQSCSHRR
jgi:hypothetical protein